MRLIKIHDTLYRLYTNECCKDINVKDGIIQIPENAYNTLSADELYYVEMNM